MTKANFKGTVEKVVRQNGKQTAQLVITVLASDAQNIPLGAVSLSIETLQSAMFGPESKKK